jgi:hypothetical protein
MKKPQGRFSPEALRIVESMKSGRYMILDQSDIAIMMLEGPKDSGSFDEAHNHSDLYSRTKWRIDIDKEFKEINVYTEFRRKLSNLRSLLVFNMSRTNRCLRSSEMVCFELNLWHVGTDKFWVLTSMISSLQL